MRVAVGSGNPVKVRATVAALHDPDATVEAVPVDSGVPEQPWGDAETARGAETRAGRALDAGEYDLGVGIEGGVARVDGVDGRFLVMWAAATDGERTGLGAGPRLRLPAAVAERLAAGDELGPVMDDLTGESGIKHDRGAAGVLTGGAIDREGALRQAVAGALGPFATDHYRDDGSDSAGGGSDPDVSLTPATPPDLDRVESLLDAADLPTADVRDGTASFFLARAEGGEPVGTGGLEVDGSATGGREGNSPGGREGGGPIALLRSVAVEESARGRGYGTVVARRLVEVARSLGVRECYLLTTDAAGFFERLGFERVGRESVPEPVLETAQFAELSPTTAVAMRRVLD